MPAAEPEQRLTEREMAYALYLLKVHMPLLSPGAKVCRNCGWPMPCPTRRLTHQLLVAAGLSVLTLPDLPGSGQVE